MKTRMMLTMLVEDPGVVVTEYLRYAGAVSVRGGGHTGYVPIEVERKLLGNETDRPSVTAKPGSIQPDRRILVTVECPDGLLQDVWAGQQKDRLRSFGVRSIEWRDRR